MSAAIPRPNPRAVFRELSEGAVVLHLETGQYHSLNPSGSAIYKLIDGRRSPHEIASAFREQLDDPPDDVEGVVTTFLEGLRERDLLQG